MQTHLTTYRMWPTKHTRAYNLLIETEEWLMLKSHTGDAENIVDMLNVDVL